MVLLGYLSTTKKKEVRAANGRQLEKVLFTDLIHTLQQLCLAALGYQPEQYIDPRACCGCDHCHVQTISNRSFPRFGLLDCQIVAGRGPYSELIFQEPIAWAETGTPAFSP